MMDFSMDPMSCLSLGELDLFPEYILPHGPSSKDQSYGEDIFCLDFPSTVPNHQDLSLDEDVFPEWLDLKMDLSCLEGLAGTTQTVLDDLLLSEVTPAGPWQDATLSSLRSTSTKTPVPSLPSASPLAVEQFPLELLLNHMASVNVDGEWQEDVLPPSPQGKCTKASEVPCSPSLGLKQQETMLSSPLTACHLGLLSPPQTPPPSSPECQVPEVNSPDSPQSLLSPVSDHEYVLESSPIAPINTSDTVLTFVAPVPVMDATDRTEALTLDNILSVSFLLGTGDTIDVLDPSRTSLEKEAKPRKDRKRKATEIKELCGKEPKMSKGPTEKKERGAHSSISLKKERKRKQNKDAAMRYRMKKRVETDVLADEEVMLQEENRKLKESAQQLSRELGYLKNLMREMFKAKGLL